MSASGRNADIGRPAMRFRKKSGQIPRAPGKRISGQMARFSGFSKEKARPDSR
jgi:hypothetical protein